MNAVLRSLSVILGLDSVIYLADNGTETNLPVLIQNILNCVPKTNKAFTGLERHEGKWLMTIFILGWSNPFKYIIKHCWQDHMTDAIGDH